MSRRTQNLRLDENIVSIDQDTIYRSLEGIQNNFLRIENESQKQRLISDVVSSVQMDEEDFENSDVTLKGGDLPMEDSDYTFLQFHSHWGSATEPGSEHTVDGKRFDAEVNRVIMLREF